MSKGYYYLISSLPDIIINEDWKKHPFLNFHDFCSEEMSDSDFRELKKCFILNDIRNIVSSQNGSDSYVRPSFYTNEEFRELMSDPDGFFPFIADFLYECSKDIKSYSGMTAEDELVSRLFVQIDKFADPFVNGYLFFELHLRNICTALSHRQSGLEYKKKILACDYFSEQIAHSSSPDFGLGGETGIFEPLLDKFGKAEPVELEMEIDMIRWQWLDDAVGLDGFSREAVFAFAVKLASVERWLNLDEGKGRNMLDSLIEQTKKSVEIDDKE